MTLSFDTVRAIAVDLSLTLFRQGAPAVVIVNGDFGNRAPLAAAAQYVLDRRGGRVLVVNYPGLAEVAGRLCNTEPAGHGLMHAEEFETSVVLALSPDAVDMSAAVAEYPDFPPTFPDLPAPLHELSRSGVFGDPRPASAELGERLLTGLADRAVELVRAFWITLPATSPPPAPPG